MQTLLQNAHAPRPKQKEFALPQKLKNGKELRMKAPPEILQLQQERSQKLKPHLPQQQKASGELKLL